MLSLEIINDYAKMWKNGDQATREIIVTELSIHWDMPESMVREKLSGLTGLSEVGKTILETGVELKVMDMRPQRHCWIADVASGVLCAMHSADTALSFVSEGRHAGQNSEFMDKCVQDAILLAEAIDRQGLKPWREDD